MSNETEIRERFWKSLKSDRTFMLGLSEDRSGHAQPMTAILEDEEGGPIWIFSAKDVDLVRQIGEGARGMGQFASKGHDLFATFEGDLTPVNDRTTIERLWHPFIAAWYEGKDDPKLQLLRFDPDRAQIWLSDKGLFAGMKLLLSGDPQRDYQDKVAHTDLSRDVRPS